MRYSAGAIGVGLGMWLALAACLDDSSAGDVAALDTSSPDLGGDAAAEVVDADATLDGETTIPADTSPADTSPDTSPADASPDTSPADASPDTIPAETTSDTSTADTTPSDTSPADTPPSDTVTPPDPAAPGPLAFEREAIEVAGFTAALFTPETAAPVPAIVLAPGFQLEGASFELYGAHLASHGIAVLIPTFGDSLFSPIAHSTLADRFVDMIAWLAADPRFDPARLGAAGHSRGGKIAFLATTRSTSIKAAFGLDPVDTAGGPGAQPSAENPSVTPELMDLVKVPLAVLGSAYGGTPTSAFAPACAPVEDNYQAYARAATATPALYEWLAPGSGHNDFADPLPFLLSLACKAGDDPPATRALAKARLVAFFKRHLEGDLRYQPPQ